MAMVSADSASFRKCTRSADWARSRRRGVSVGHSHLLDCRVLPTQSPSASAARPTVPMNVASLAERLGGVVSRDMPFLDHCCWLTDRGQAAGDLLAGARR